MFPTVTLEPEMSALDSRIRPLIAIMNKLMIPTYWSCEGHGTSAGLIQSQYPKVSFVPEPTQDGAWHFMTFTGMIGVHNDRREFEVKWVLMPVGDAGRYNLQPHARCWHLELTTLHNAIDEMVETIQILINRRYRPDAR
jgi:hypothetical protein